jgi:hypothetical protein
MAVAGTVSQFHLCADGGFEFVSHKQLPRLPLLAASAADLLCAFIPSSVHLFQSKQLFLLWPYGRGFSIATDTNVSS